MGTILLEGLEFFARHGYYDEEKKLGNRFIVDVIMETDFSVAAENDDLSGTINYEQVYAIISKEMQTPSKLLENISHRIMRSLLQSFTQLDSVEVKLSKMNPPLGGICRNATVIVKECRR